MGKVRFSCPRCQTVMQTNEDKIGYDIACPHCTYRFKLVEPAEQETTERRGGSNLSEQTLPPRNHGGGSSSQNLASKQPPPQIQESPREYPSITPWPAQSPNQFPQGRFQCPYCQTHSPPKMQSEINTTGWVVFGVLLVTTCVFCWVGFFIRDNFRVCSKCSIRL